jgi:putative heme transporter
MLPSTKQRARKILLIVFSIFTLFFIFAVVFPAIADYRDVARQIRSLSPRWIVVLLLAEIANLATYAPNWMRALPGLGYVKAFRMTTAGTAVVNVAPVGGPISMTMQFAMLRNWGFERSVASRAMVLTGIWSQAANLGLPLVGLFLLTLTGGANTPLLIAAILGLVVFTIFTTLFMIFLFSSKYFYKVALLSEKLINKLYKITKKNKVSHAVDAMSHFRSSSIALIRQRWRSLTATTLLGTLTVFLAFFVCVRAVGLPDNKITLIEAFATWTTTRLLSSVPIAGGLGLIDVGLAGSLIAFGASDATAVSAVLLYRVLTWLPPVVIGGINVVHWRHQQQRLTALQSPKVIQPLQ